MIEIGDKVSKVGGDYRFNGVVVAAFNKLSGAKRLVVEDNRGVLHIYSEKNVVKRQPPPLQCVEALVLPKELPADFEVVGITRSMVEAVYTQITDALGAPV